MKINKSQIARELDVNRKTVDKYLHELVVRINNRVNTQVNHRMFAPCSKLRDSTEQAAFIHIWVIKTVEINTIFDQARTALDLAAVPVFLHQRKVPNKLLLKKFIAKP